jgi:hypothetical protein
MGSPSVVLRCANCDLGSRLCSTPARQDERFSNEAKSAYLTLIRLRKAFAVVKVSASAKAMADEMADKSVRPDSQPAFVSLWRGKTPSAPRSANPPP